MAEQNKNRQKSPAAQGEAKGPRQPARRRKAAPKQNESKKAVQQAVKTEVPAEAASERPRQNRRGKKQGLSALTAAQKAAQAVASVASTAMTTAAKMAAEQADPRQDGQSLRPRKAKGQKGKDTGPKLRIVPLGGLNEIGKNMTVLEYGDDIVVVDCGMTFPDDELLGVDLVIPDITYLIKNAHKVRGIVITHAHEDHIGAIPYVLRELNVPIYCTALTGGLIRLRLEEHRNIKKPKIQVRKAGDKFKLGVFEVEMIHVNHSVPDACAVAVKTPLGVVIMTGDFKIDTTPIDGKMIDLERFGQLGRQGVLMLMCDSTNAERPGIAMSERRVGESMAQHFKTDKRIIVATFASNVHRIQQIINIAHQAGRKVAVSGRSMDNILKIGTELGYITTPPGTMIELNDIKKYPANKLVVITTGSQGETMSALYRMAFSGHRQVDVGPGDKILIAASPIPGNEKSVYGMINELFRRGAEVVYEKLADIHVSGHACQEEIKMILSLTRPQYYMPVHGEFRHLMVNANLGRVCGVAPENIFIGDLGKVLEIGADSAGFTETVPAGRVLVDGYGVGEVGNAVLKERRHLGEDGVIAAVAAVDVQNGTILSGPEIFTRGFIFVREAEELMEEMREVTRQALESCFERKMTSRHNIREYVAARLGDHLRRKTKRDPVIVPVIIET